MLAWKTKSSPGYQEPVSKQFSIARTLRLNTTRAGCRHTDGVKQARFSAAFKPCTALGGVQDHSVRYLQTSQASHWHHREALLDKKLLGPLLGYGRHM